MDVQADVPSVAIHSVKQVFSVTCTLITAPPHFNTHTLTLSSTPTSDDLRIYIPPMEATPENILPSLSTGCTPREKKKILFI